MKNYVTIQLVAAKQHTNKKLNKVHYITAYGHHLPNVKYNQLVERRSKTIQSLKQKLIRIS